MIRRRLFFRREDRHCVVFHLVLMLAYGCAFYLYRHPGLVHAETPLRRAVFALAAAMALGWCSGINVGVNFHSAAHRKIFRRTWVNRWFERTWTVSGGWPAFFWEHSHITVHHDNILQESDWTLPRRRADGSWENPYWYCLVQYPWRYGKHLWRDFTTGRGGPGVGRRALKELAIFIGLFSIPFFVDWRMALWLWLLPAWLANASVMGPGMVAQHAGRFPGSATRPFTHSNTFTGRFFNLTMFNIGYHIEHHHFGGVHWSALPALHERMRDGLVRGGGHVVPFGYYRGAHLLLQGVWVAEQARKFHAQHPDYRRSSSAAGVAPGHDRVAVGRHGWSLSRGSPGEPPPRTPGAAGAAVALLPEACSDPTVRDDSPARREGGRRRALSR